VAFVDPNPLEESFPWEFVLAEATRPLRHASLQQDFLVARYLQQTKRSNSKLRRIASGLQPGATLSEPTSVLVVECAPGALDNIYSFEAERRLVTSSLAFGDSLPLQNPDRQALRQRITTDHPDIVHITGVDSAQGAELLNLRQESAAGIYVDAGGQPVVLTYPDLAKLIVPDAGRAQPSDVRPKFVAFNMYNSSLGAAAVVARGVEAAIGFQDEIDDRIAELFFATFYSEWKSSGWDLLAAYRAAWRNLGTRRNIRGTGIVLWSNRPLINAPIRPVNISMRPPSSGEPILPDSVNEAYERFQIDCKPPTRLNYSLLHNNANIYPEFTIKRQRPGVYRGIVVEVRLSVGPEEAAYRAIFNLDDQAPVAHVHEKVRVSLTSTLNRLLDESMYSTISTTVRWGKHHLYEDTVRVELLPVDEWKYDVLNGRWLPSFVFPRDPTVRRIVDAAQRYLIALRDDSRAGFDGYQSYDPLPASMNDQCRSIDAQVQALWWALVYDFSPGYINPPPSFSDDAQRLRTPTEVIEGRRGTCIDLALLFASCLEYIEIYPVIFLLNDHAFPGYWRSEPSYDRLNSTLIASATLPPLTAATEVPDAPWMLGKAQFSDVIELVQQGHIVPIESVSLTTRSGFWEAIDEGLQNLRSKLHFHSMFDIKTARRHVTPIPIWSKRA
jgi:hypothetical protein